MRYSVFIINLICIIIVCVSCKKDRRTAECLSDVVTVRQILNRPALIKVTATRNPVEIIEQGSIDTKLIPCNFPMEYIQDGLMVIISGDVKSTPQVGPGPCCFENLVITKISRY